MIELKVWVRCDIEGCKNSFSQVANISEKQIMGVPHLLRKVVRDVEGYSGFGIRETGGKREALCPDCWEAEFKD
jgi:hypothetical protein